MSTAVEIRRRAVERCCVKRCALGGRKREARARQRDIIRSKSVLSAVTPLHTVSCLGRCAGTLRRAQGGGESNTGWGCVEHCSLACYAAVYHTTPWMYLHGADVNGGGRARGAIERSVLLCGRRRSTVRSQRPRLGGGSVSVPDGWTATSWRWRGWAQSCLEYRRCNCRLSGVALVVCRLVAVCPVAARGGVPSAVRLYEESYP